MKECVNKYFFYADECKNSEEFDNSLLSYGQCIYEVIRVIDGKLLFFERHIDRMKNSLKLVNLDMPYDREKIKQRLGELIKVNEVKEGNIKIVFNFKENMSKPVFLVYFIEHYYPTQNQYKNGVDTILFYGERNNPNAKIIDSDFRSRVRSQIEKSGAFEAILVDHDNNITEGSKSNVFFVKDRKIITSPVSDVLPGVTREVIIKICRDNCIEVIERKINVNEIKNLDGAFISGTSPKVLPIRKIDNYNFSSSVNDVILKIMQYYNEVIGRYIMNY